MERLPQVIEQMPNMDRRQFIKGTGGAIAMLVAALSESGCATMFPKFPSDAYFKGDPRIGIDWHEHRLQPRGIDLINGYGHPLSAPISRDIWYANSPTSKNNFVIVEHPLGFIVGLTGLRTVYANYDQKVNPFMILGEEGDKAAGEPGKVHTHIGIEVPHFFTLFRKGDFSLYTHGGVEEVYDNPHRHTANGGSLLTSIFDGDNSIVERLAKESGERFEAIGKKYPDAHLGWFINESKEQARLFPRIMASYIMLKHGLIQEEKR